MNVAFVRVPKDRSVATQRRRVSDGTAPNPTDARRNKLVSQRNGMNGQHTPKSGVRTAQVCRRACNLSGTSANGKKWKIHDFKF